MYLVDKLASNLRFDEPRLQGGGGGGGGGGAWEDRGGTGRRSLRVPRREPPAREESWGSASDRDASSDDEADKSIGFKSNGQFRNTLNKARTLCDKWRGSGGGGGGSTAAADCTSLPGDISPGGRLSRWFSVRRGSGHQYDVATEPSPAKMPQLPEVDEDTVCGSTMNAMGSLGALPRWDRRQAPPALPPPPPGLSPQQLKRRHIVAAIIHSENSYVATLQRLVNEYKKPLEENPAILSSAKINTLFHRLPDILQCHTLFRIALADCVRNWDREEKLGDVFVASFSKALVLDIYSGFINNFSVAMDLAKMEAKRKSALADFLKVKQIGAHDRLSFFGLMVKPVQRFPQFILFLQDLLKHTPQGHHDRMSLQLALTQLESLAEMLNERKREAEQSQAFKEMLRNISSKFTARPLTDGNRHLLREDNVTQLEFNQAGMITKTKSRRLLLLNDLVVCVSVAPRQSEEFGANERLSLKWMHPVADLEIVDSSASPTLSRILTAGLHRGGSLKSTSSGEGTGPGTVGAGADSLCSEMSALMHDYEVVSRIADLAGTLRGQYNELSQDTTKRLLQQIQHSIQRKDEEMAWVDSCCLQIVAKNKSSKEETYTFQTENPYVKKDWITELRLAQLALDSNNSPGWEVLEQEQRSSTKMPLFVKAQPVYKSQHQTEVRCGCYYNVSSNNVVGVAGARSGSRRRKGPRGYLWVCTTDGASSHIAILGQHAQHAGQLRDVGAFDLVETQVIAMEFVKGISEDNLITSDSVWLGTDSRKIFLYAANEPEKQDQISQTIVPAIITQIKYHCDCVFVALGNGSVLIFHRDMTGAWSLKDPITINLGIDPVSCLLPINLSVYAACGKKVWVISGLTGEIQKSFSVQHEHIGNVNLMAHSGVGLWISLKNSSTICLYHTETFKHLQDINLASNVLRVMGNANCGSHDCFTKGGKNTVTVSALLACRGLLWVGTSAGISLTIPLPRLEGVPIISGRVNISYHSHFGPITFLLALHPRTYNVNPYYNSQPIRELPAPPPKENEVNNKEVESTKDGEKAIEPIEKKENEKQKLEKQLSDNTMQTISAKLKHQLTSSPVVIRRRRSKDNEMSRLSKTLPRGLGAGAGAALFCSTTSSQGSGDACDVYGLYGELMYVKDCEGESGTLGEPAYETLRRSDPELAAIPAKVSTLDRKLRMKVSRPRSLDLSNWSVDSRSSSLYTSSGSEESMALRGGLGRSISRNNSNASRTIQLSNGSSDVVNITVNINNITSTLNSGLTNGNALHLALNNRSVSRSNSVVQDAIDAKNKNKKNMNNKANSSNDPSRKTVITLMGGRGYVNWRQSCCIADRQRASLPPPPIREPNKTDAHIVVWETKL
ncbi:rho guanine nucleotide exchange factor 10-like protein isoform X5 [Arctopsyche grandis]|uniref:rho guanine nucleotide exchange factor 10-like protein isoform X5 n=1 Tax=Arctopsyche grandis TaxID=121162 RepID=UPI00406D80B5